MKKAITVLMFGVAVMILTGCNMTNNGGVHMHLHDLTANTNITPKLNVPRQNAIGQAVGQALGQTEARGMKLTDDELKLPELKLNGPYKVSDYLKDAQDLKKSYDESKKEIESLHKATSWFNPFGVMKVLVPVATVAVAAYKWTHAAPEAPKLASTGIQADSAYESPYTGQEMPQEANWDVQVQPLEYPVLL